MSTFYGDLRYGVKMLTKRPGFTVTAVLVMALGIGANTALFSVVQSVLLSPLPFKDAERLVSVRTLWKSSGGTSPASGPDYIDWAERNQVMDGLCAYDVCRLNLTGSGEPLALQGLRATVNLFDVMKPEMALGRGFRQDESQVGNHYVTVLSHNLWRDHFASDPSIIGKTITLDGAPYTVIGVAGPLMGFIEEMVRIYVPIPRDQLIKGGRSYQIFQTIGRIKPDISFAQAQAQMDQVALQIAKENPNSNVNKGVRIYPIHEVLVGSFRTAFLVLYGAVTVLLLVACVNVSNLLVAKASARSREIAIRQAFGAGRIRLIRQLLTESVLLGILGGILGLILAFWSLNMLQLIAPRIQETGGNSLPGFEEIRVNLPVLGFTLVVSLIASLAFGMLPAWQGTRFGIVNTLKETGQSVSHGRTRHRTLGTLVVAQIALAMILLTGAGLLIKSFVKLQNSHPGFNADRLLALHVVRPETTENNNQQKRADYFNRVLEKLAAL
ncbi:MAG: ABC transporter permease, partial [Planctomycetota bacterium]